MQPKSLTESTSDYVPVPQAEGGTPNPGCAAVTADLAAMSHQGKVRPNNEDNFLVVRFGRFLQTMLTSLPEGHVPDEFGEAGYGMIVADGMGGMAAGEVASQLAITLLINLVLETPDWILGCGDSRADQVIARSIQRFETVNAALVEQARRQPELQGMGTTLTMAISLGTDLLIVHVGDSPAYLSRGGELHKLTRDHTVAQEMADHESIPIEDVPSRFHHILTQAIGVRDDDTEPDFRRLRLADGDRLLLCTDGLTDMVDEPTIAAVLQRQASSDEVCKTLVDLALEGGGKDNVTVVVAGYRVPPEPCEAG
jgi:protein phosphatase